MESAEEASAGADLVVEAILEDLQVSTSLEFTLKVPEKDQIPFT